MKSAPARKSEQGFTLLEIMIVSLLVGVVIFLASSASGSITNVASDGLRRLQVEADCQNLLHSLANDLQNSSTDDDPTTLVPRFEIEEAADVKELVSFTAESAAVRDPVDSSIVTEDECLESRPRLNVFQKNSRFRFQKVFAIDVDPDNGEVTPVWSPPISYFLVDRNLVRDDDGYRQVVATGVTVFRIVAEPNGNFRIFVRIQRRNPGNGEIHTASGMIEVNPKNN